MLRIRKDLDYLKNAEPQLQTELKSLTDNSTETMTIASSRKVISARVKIKKQQRAMKRDSVRKIARTHKANKRKSSIRKIHISIEKNIHVITTNSCQHCNNFEHMKRQENFINHEAHEKVSQNSIIKEFQIGKCQFKKLFLIFSVRMLKEMLLI